MKKLRKSARNRDCQVRLAGICNFDPTTTVLAHLGGGGMGMKKPDIFGAFCCSSCHDILDGRVMSLIDRSELELAHRQGVERTQKIWLDEGLIRAG
ncbi:MAG: nuclease domain-containing protein [Gammaproteobacteria bacterium]|nr:nuclease domain-containing protein [Gammaproteobacteria bacterium]